MHWAIRLSKEIFRSRSCAKLHRLGKSLGTFPVHNLPFISTIRKVPSNYLYRARRKQTCAFLAISIRQSAFPDAFQCVLSSLLDLIGQRVLFSVLYPP